MKQSFIIFIISIIRINTRLIRAFQFLRQFRFKIKHKSDKKHIMSDALSRLASQKPFVIMFEDHLKLDAFYINYNYFFTQVQMSDTFRAHLSKIYVKNDK